MESQLVEICWRNLRIKTRDGKEILQSVNGQIQPGKINLFVGCKQSGKIELAKCILGRLDSNYTAEGEVFVNGCEKTGNIMHKIVCYISEAVSSYDFLTVEESLVFASQLLHLHFNEIEKILDFIDLNKSKRISALTDEEQFKFSLALGLLNNPSVLVFEDSIFNRVIYNSEIFEVLKKLANLGKTILLLQEHTSYKMLPYLDKIFVFARGYDIFQGKIDQGIQFFNEAGYEVPSGINPIDFFTVTLSNDDGLPYGSYKKIDSLRKEWSFMRESTNPSIQKSIRLKSTSKQRSNSIAELLCLFRKMALQILRNISSLKYRIYQRLAIYLFFCVAFYKVESTNPLNLFFVGMIEPLFYIFSCMPEYKKQLKIARKETTDRLYLGHMFFTAKFVAEILTNSLLSLPFLILFYLCSSLKHPFYLYLSLLCINIYAISFLLALSAIISVFRIANLQAYSVYLTIVQMAYSGLFTNLSFLKYFSALSPFHYILTFLVCSQYNTLPNTEFLFNFKDNTVFLTYKYSILMILLFSIFNSAVGCLSLNYASKINLSILKKPQIDRI